MVLSILKGPIIYCLQYKPKTFSPPLLSFKVMFNSMLKQCLAWPQGLPNMSLYSLLKIKIVKFVFTSLTQLKGDSLVILANFNFLCLFCFIFGTQISNIFLLVNSLYSLNFLKSGLVSFYLIGSIGSMQQE